MSFRLRVPGRTNIMRSYPHNDSKSHVSLDLFVDARYVGFAPSTHYEVTYLEWDGYDNEAEGLYPHYNSHRTEFFALTDLSKAIQAVQTRVQSMYPHEASAPWKYDLASVAVRDKR